MITPYSDRRLKDEIENAVYLAAFIVAAHPSDYNNMNTSVSTALTSAPALRMTSTTDQLLQWAAHIRTVEPYTTSTSKHTFR
jgi:hypothetical protein